MSAIIAGGSDKLLTSALSVFVIDCCTQAQACKALQTDCVVHAVLHCAALCVLGAHCCCAPLQPPVECHVCSLLCFACLQVRSNLSEDLAYLTTTTSPVLEKLVLR